MSKRMGLGRGLESLLSPEAIPDRDTPDIFMCPIEKIRPNPSQPRLEMDQEALEALARSIEENGILQPLVVREVEDLYEIICGERRWRAAQKAGLTRVPVVIKDVSPSQVLELALIENIQREDLNPVEEAIAYRRLIEDFGLNQKEVAKRVGKERSTIANSIRLLNLPQPILRDLSAGRLSAGHARALLMVDDEEKMFKLRDEILTKGLNVRQAETAAKRLNQRPARKRAKIPDPNIERLEEELCLLSGLKVNIKPLKTGGKIELRYSKSDELDIFLERLRRINHYG